MSILNSKERLKKIQDILRFVIYNSYSNFYKDKYKNSDIKKILSEKNNFLENFKSIPFLTKDEILEIDFKKRTFCSNDRILSYFIASGTTKSKRISIVPFSGTVGSFTKIVFAKKKMEKLGVKSVLFLAPVNHGLSRQMIFAKERNIVCNFADMNKLELSGRMIKEIGIQGIATMPAVLEAALPHIEEAKALKQIKWIVMTGEFCSQQKKEYFQKFFTNACFDFIYGLAEAPGLVAYRCEDLKNKDLNIYHPIPEKLIEIVCKDGKDIEKGEIGEIVVTNLTKNAFPLIRYRTGDMGILKTKKCKCGVSQELELLGRFNYDFLKFQGITLHTKAVENALVQFNEILEPTFLMEVFEREVESRVVPELLLTLVAKKTLNFLNPKEISNKISQSLQVSATKTLEDLIREKIFLPLRIEFVPEIKTTHFKRISIVSHLNEVKND